MIHTATAGDQFTDVDGRRQFVREPCHASPYGARGFFCLTCRQPLANIYQLEAHEQSAPRDRHVIATDCKLHGWEAAVVPGAQRLKSPRAKKITKRTKTEQLDLLRRPPPNRLD